MNNCHSDVRIEDFGGHCNVDAYCQVPEQKTIFCVSCIRAKVMLQAPVEPAQYPPSGYRSLFGNSLFRLPCRRYNVDLRVVLLQPWQRQPQKLRLCVQVSSYVNHFEPFII
jgi:hypothetical protein